MRKCGRRSYQGPGMPCCSVQFSAECPARGWSFWVASLAPKNSGAKVVRDAGVEAALDPDLGDAVVLPVGEEADAVAAEEDLVEVVFELRDGEVFVDGLGDLEGGLDVEGDFGDDAEGSEIDDGAEESGRRLWRGRDGWMLPSAATNSMAETAVERLPFLLPEPWVAVAQAPTTETWGSEARLWTAKPRESM